MPIPSATFLTNDLKIASIHCIHDISSVDKLHVLQMHFERSASVNGPASDQNRKEN